MATRTMLGHFSSAYIRTPHLPANHRFPNMQHKSVTMANMWVLLMILSQLSVVDAMQLTSAKLQIKRFNLVSMCACVAIYLAYENHAYTKFTDLEADLERYPNSIQDENSMSLYYSYMSVCRNKYS